MTYHQLNREQRHTIAQLHKQGNSLRSIARTIEVHVNTVSRELRCNSHKRGYSARMCRCSLTNELLGRSNGLPNRYPVVFV